MGWRKYEAIIASNKQNRYGHTPRVEELLRVAEMPQGAQFSINHDVLSQRVGKILKTWIDSDESGQYLVVKALIEIDDSDLQDDLLRNLLENGGISPTYEDGYFVVDETSNGSGEPFVKVYFDAYKADETTLYLNARALSKSLNAKVICVRVRQHFLEEAVFVLGISIAEHLLSRLWDDLELYDHLKRFLLSFFKSSDSESQVRIGIRSAEKRCSEIVVPGNAEVLSEVLDHLSSDGYLLGILAELAEEQAAARRVKLKVVKSDQGYELKEY